MRYNIKQSLTMLSSLGLALTLAAPLSAQAPRPSERTPLPGRYNTSVGPSTLRAGIWNDPCCQIFLVFPAVIGAEKYRVTRAASPSTPETVIYEAAVTSFVAANWGYTCTALPGIQPTACVFGDVGAKRDVTYTYRVWAIYPGAVVSPPSPPASAWMPPTP